ncbi:MAG: ABC transporter permease [Bryobacteraceae bacterium]|nr:ABC transporter permease [Bryobacteraceae bacterium]
MWRDIRLGFRSLRRDAKLSALIIAVVALGVGANTAVFSLINGTLLKPLPFERPDRVVFLWETAPSLGLAQNHVSLPNFADWKRAAKSFDDMAAGVEWSYNLTGAGEPRKLNGVAVTANLFSVLGARPAHGRLFHQSEEPGSERVAVLSDSLWRMAFGGDRTLVGRQIMLNDAGFTVIGIMPPGFQFPRQRADLWVPAVFPEFLRRARGAHLLTVIARIRDGVTLDASQREMSAIAQRLAAQYPGSNAGAGVRLKTAAEEFTGSVRRPYLLLTAAAVFVLLIVCANVSNLLLVRAANRRRETAVRLALGAGRGRLARQSLAENLLVSAAGAALGLLLAVWTFDVLSRLVPFELTYWAGIGLDVRVLVFAAALALFTSLAFSIAPALAARGLRPYDALRVGGAAAASDARGSLVRRALVVTQFALAVALVAGAGLLIRTLVNLRSVELGFQTRNILALRTELPRPRYGELQTRETFYREVLDRLRSLPGVVAAGFSSYIPLAGSGELLSFTPEGAAPSFTDQPHARCRFVTEGYLEALNIPLEAGRYFNQADGIDSAPVAIVNKALVDRYWSGGGAVGRRLKIGERNSQHAWMTVAGVVGNARQQRLDLPAAPELYVLHRQGRASVYYTPQDLVVRTTGDPLRLAGLVRQTVQAVDSTVPIAAVRTIEDVLDEAVAARRIQTTLLASFGGLALLLAALGVYGVTSYSVARRTREIGLRMALGALPSAVLRSVLRQGIGLALVGIAAGVPATLLIARALDSFLFGVSAADPLTFAGVAAALLVAAAFASYLPARRATRIDPMAALRQE